MVVRTAVATPLPAANRGRSPAGYDRGLRVQTAGFGSGEMVHYGAPKAALLGLSRGLANAMAGSGVTVNAFPPRADLPPHAIRSWR
jgi:NAD(P)-dependent dehydrogenase (short-subunit alcohol dehydrogenase family)